MYSEVHHILCCVVYLRIVRSTTYWVTNNTTQYVVDITIRKQTTQHNMWWTSLYVNKQHNIICGGPHYKLCCLFTHSDVHHILCCVVCLCIVRSTTCCVVCLRIVMFTTYCVVLFHNIWWISLYVNKQHNTICGGPHYTYINNTIQYVVDLIVMSTT
jgi:hypothetical protein